MTSTESARSGVIDIAVGGRIEALVFVYFTSLASAALRTSGIIEALSCWLDMNGV